MADYTLSIKSEGNGNASYNGESVRNATTSFSITEGENATIEFYPDFGYQIKSAIINNVDITSSISNNHYTVNNISANTSIEVEFEVVPSPIVESFEVDGINYIISEDNTVSVTQRNNKYYGEVVIPSQVTYNGKNYNVTSIGIDAFYGCSEIISVTIPNSVSNIAEGAFSGCSILEVYCYAETVPQTDVAAFHGTPTEKSTLFVPANAIEAYETTWPWSDFKEIVAIGSTPDDDQTISGECGDNVNYTYNKKTHTLTISGKGGIAGIYPLEDEKAPWESYINEILTINIESGVTSIGQFVFMGSTSLTSVSIPNSVTYIGMEAFLGCSGLTSVHITDLEAWCKIQFRSNPLEYAHHLYMNGKEIKDLVIPSSVTSISSKAFFGCNGLTSITIPPSVTSIGEKAFTNCSGITSIIVENGNLTYDSRDNCNALIETANNTLITGCVNSIIPYGVTSIGENAFSECANLTSIIIPNSVSSIGSYAFRYCTNLASVDIPNSVISVGSNVFEGTSWYDNLPDGLVYFGRVAYYYKGEMPDNTNYTINEGTVEIYDRAFYGQSGLISITLPNSVISIGKYAFYQCSLTSVIIPNSVETIGDNAFDHLSSVVLGKNVKSIGKNAFAPYYKGEPTTVISLIENPFPILGKGLGDIWSEFTFRTFDEATLYVPVGTIDKYKATDGWKDFVHIEEGTGGFEIPDDNMQINGKCGENVYYSYDSATYTLTISGQGAMYNWMSYPWFSYKTDIHHLLIESGVTSISDYAFESCRGLTSITIPRSITSFGSRAFDGCSGLSSVISEIENPFEIDNTVFNGIPSDVQLIVPNGSKAKYQATSGWNNFQNIVEAGSGNTDLSVNGINYLISSESDYTVMVSNGNYGRVLEVPATISFRNNTWNVIGLTDGALDDNGELAAIIWNPLIAFNASVSNPNLLLYVKDKAYKSSDIKNVVVNGIAENIELADAASGNDFYCPRSFTAKKISYTHDYKMETGIGESKGWETIVLPFDVQKYTHTTKGEIEPFTAWNMGSNTKPFWLFELTASGYKDVASIKANTPYIISMPNNKQYEQQYQIPGIVTFSASNVEVQKTDDLKPVSYQGRTFVPNYSNKAGDNLLALNVNSYYVTNSSTDKDGSKFIKGLRSAHPFEAYMITTDGTRSIDVQDGMTTSIKGVGMVKDGECVMKVYDIRGVLLKTSTSKNNIREGLKAGVYIVNGKKEIIK